MAVGATQQALRQQEHPERVQFIVYRANSKVSRNPNFCVGCFELIMSKNFAAASKMGKNGQKKKFLRFFLRNPFLRRVLDQNLFFLRFFFAFGGLGLIPFVATTRNRAYLGLWDCIPFLHRHTNVDQLDSGIAVHSTDKHQQAWFRSTSPPRRDPRPAGLLLCTNNQQTNLNHTKTGKPISRTSPFICFGAHQQPHSTILTLVTIPDASFSETKARCRMGHETQKRGTTNSGANSPAILAFLQKRGQEQKLFYFCDFLSRNPFLRKA